MDDIIPDVIITSSNACAIYDAKSTNEIASYKDGNITFTPKTLSLIGGDFLIGALSNKPILKVWAISKKRNQDCATFVVPGIVSVLTVSSCGNYCVAGIKEQIFVWEISSGDMQMILSRHYQSVSCLKFTADDSRFFSGGKDGHVMVWVLSCVVDVNARSDNIKPLFVWNNHSSEVTDIYCGNSISRVATTSLDMTCKIYELDSGMLLSTICMDVPLTAVVMDPLEYFIFLGDEQGYFYRISTYERLPHEIHGADENNKAALKAHETAITTLAVSFDGTRIMTASEDRSIKMWDIQSMSNISKIHFEGPLTNAFLAPRPACFSDPMILPQMYVREFRKELSLSNSTPKCIESRISRKELSLMYDGCPDKHYSHSIFCRPADRKVSTMDSTTVEEIFKEAIHGESISELTTLNQQLFTVFLNDQLTNMFQKPPSPT